MAIPDKHSILKGRRLERHIWDLIAEHLGSKDSAENLEHRLLALYGATPGELDDTRRGLGPLRSDSKLLELIDVAIKQNFDLYRGVVAKGLESIFDEKDEHFLRKMYHPQRDGLKKYVILSLLINPEDSLAETAKGFVAIVDRLLRIYYNLREERLSSGRYIGDESTRSQQSLRTIVENVNGNRLALTEIKYKDDLVKNAVEWLIDYSFETSEIILWGLYTITLGLISKPQDGFNLTDLESSRALIAKGIIRYPNFGTYPENVQKFYTGEKTIPEMLKPKK